MCVNLLVPVCLSVEMGYQTRDLKKLCHPCQTLGKTHRKVLLVPKVPRPDKLRFAVSLIKITH